jgi:hypothetical protein
VDLRNAGLTPRGSLVPPERQTDLTGSVTINAHVFTDTVSLGEKSASRTSVSRTSRRAARPPISDSAFDVLRRSSKPPVL